MAIVAKFRILQWAEWACGFRCRGLAHPALINSPLTGLASIGYSVKRHYAANSWPITYHP